MSGVRRRLCRLESILGSETETNQKLWVVTTVGRQLALDPGACIDILRERGFLPTTRFGVVDLHLIPEGLNAKETERFLREKLLFQHPASASNQSGDQASDFATTPPSFTHRGASAC